MKYLPRVIDAELDLRLRAVGATVIVGPMRDLIRKNNQQETQCPLREPDLLMVITGGAMGYTRPDGVHVVPISALKP